MHEPIEGARPEYIFDNVRLVRATRMPCPICGHPTGDCTADGAEPRHVIGIGIFNSLDKQMTFTVEEDIYEDRRINPHYTARVLVVRKGQKISVDKAKELGLL